MNYSKTTKMAARFGNTVTISGMIAIAIAFLATII